MVKSKMHMHENTDLILKEIRFAFIASCKSDFSCLNFGQHTHEEEQ